MKNEKKIFSIILVLAMVIGTVALSGCTQKKPNTMIVGTEALFAPFEYVENGTITGFDIEMVTAILTNLGYEVEIKDMGFQQLPQAVNDGIIDVIAAGMTIDPSRDTISFSIPYYTSDQSVLVKEDSTITITNYTDFANLKLGAQQGTTGAKWVTEHLLNQTWLQEQNINYSLNITLDEVYLSYTDAVRDLGIGRIDAVIIDKPAGNAFAAEGDSKVIYVILTNESFGLAVKKGNTELLEKINGALEEYMVSEEWNVLVKKYFG